MIKRLFGRKKPGAQNPDVRMPEVGKLRNIDEVFDRARIAAAGEGEQPPGTSGRHVIIVTPGRMLMFKSCPPPGSMPEEKVASIESMLSPEVKRNVVAIAYTELSSLNESKATIPFLGILMGFSYIGHAVWIFEGHPSALSAGCKDADVLIVDEAMIPYLQKDWASVAAGVMKNADIYVHNRATYSLSKLG